MNDITSYYELLGVSRPVDPSILHKAFRKQSKSLHPDTTDLPVDEAAEKFRRLCEAYETLADPLRREAYDSTIPGASSFEIRQKDISSQDHITAARKESSVGDLRPLSGGEWFSLLLLGAALLLSLLVGLGVALFNGREW